MNFFYKYLLMLGLSLSCTAPIMAQFTKTIQLKPIFIDRGAYYYDTKKVNDAYSLQIPLQGLENAEVNRYYENFRMFKKLRGFAYLPALLFMFVENDIIDSNPEIVGYLLGCGVAGHIAFNALAKINVRKAIALYNIAILQKSSIGLHLEKPHSNQTLISLGFHHKF